MASKKSFKPPVKNNSELVRKPKTSLTNKEYDEIFDAVIHPSQQGVNFKSPTLPTVADTSGHKAESPKESASVENSQNSQPNPAPNTENAVYSKNEAKSSEEIFAKPAKNTDTSSLNTIHSEDFIKNSVFSTPNMIIKPPKSYREALNNLKKIKDKLNDSASESGSILSNSIAELIGDGPLSQPPSQLSKIERLEWYQERRGTGLWVQCDSPKCDKWRWLDIADPCELPEKWYCHMNPDPAYASCAVPEKTIPLDVEADLIHNCYTAGSIVWGKIAGFPWWPAMVDDCPDEEQYYWVDDPSYSDTPDWYHVVFFDDSEISRKWLRLPQIKSFKNNPNFDKNFKINEIYKSRLAISKEKANEALNLHVKDRLKKFSFLSLWRKLLKNNKSDSDTKEGKEVEKKTINKAQKKNKIKTRSSNNSSNKDEVSYQKIISSKNKVEKEKLFSETPTAKSTLTRRMSTGTILKKDENLPPLKSTDNITDREKTLVKEVLNNFYNQFISGNIKLNKHDIFEEVQRDINQELCPQTPTTLPKRNNPVGSSPGETSSAEPVLKKVKKDKALINGVKRVKKSFVMPVKKNVDLNSSCASISTVSSATNGPPKIFED